MKQFIEVPVKEGDYKRMVLINVNNVTHFDEYIGNRCRIYILNKKEAILTTMSYDEIKQSLGIYF